MTRDLKMYGQIPDVDLIEYIGHFYDPEPEIDWDKFCRAEAEFEMECEEHLPLCY